MEMKTYMFTLSDDELRASGGREGQNRDSDREIRGERWLCLICHEYSPLNRTDCLSALCVKGRRNAGSKRSKSKKKKYSK